MGDISPTVQLVMDAGLIGLLVAIAVLLWNRNIKLVDKVMNVVETNTQSHTALKGAIDNNTDVIVRVDNFIRDRRGDS